MHKQPVVVDLHSHQLNISLNVCKKRDAFASLFLCRLKSLDDVEPSIGSSLFALEGLCIDIVLQL